MSRHQRLRGPIGTAALVAGVAVAVPASAGAAPQPTTSSSASTITLDAAFRKALRTDGLVLRAGKPASLKGSRLRLPVTASTTSGSTATLTHAGSLAARRGSRSVALTSWRTVVQARSAAVSALIAKKRVTVLTISGGTVKTDAKSGKVTISGGRVKLSTKGAKALRGRLKGSRLKAGTVGRVATAATPRPATPAPTTPAPVAPAPTTPAPAVPTAPTTPTTPTTPTDPVPVACPLPAAGATPLTGKTTWRLRSSWVTYLYLPIWTGTKGVFGTDGADRTTAGQNISWDYPQASISTSAAGETIIANTGQLQFRMDEHAIDTRIRDPRIVIAADGRSARLCADGQSSGEMANPGTGAPFENAHLLDLDLAAGSSVPSGSGGRVLTGVPATVADDATAAEVLSYPANDEYGSLDIPVPTP